MPLKQLTIHCETERRRPARPRPVWLCGVLILAFALGAGALAGCQAERAERGGSTDSGSPQTPSDDPTAPDAPDEASETPSPTDGGSAEVPNTAVPIMPSADHVPRGAEHEPYNTDPPTSGEHYDVPADAGFYTKAPPDEELVHSLEHGYVVIWYKADDLAPAQRSELIADIKAAMGAAGDSPLTGTPKLIAVPRPTLTTRLALTTWGRLQRLESFDEAQIVRFIDAFRDQAPEGDIP